MGLTIHMEFKANSGIKEATIRRKVEAMRQIALDLPFAHVGEVEEVVLNEEDRTQWPPRELVVITRERVTEHYSRVNACKWWEFLVAPGEGCEAFAPGLALFPSPQPDDHPAVQKHLRRHRRPKKSDFCKTEYAYAEEFGGLSHFLRCHVATVDFLERCRSIPGLEVAIHDEGNYAEGVFRDGRRPATHDLEVLVDSIAVSREGILELGGALKAAFGDQVQCGVSLEGRRISEDTHEVDVQAQAMAIQYKEGHVDWADPLVREIMKLDNIKQEGNV